MESHAQYPYDTELVVRCLRDGGVVVVPTDTVYGIAVSPLHPVAVERLYALKQRPRNKFLPIMVAREDDLVSLNVELSEPVKRLLHSSFVPGPLTLALGFNNASRPTWLEGREEIALRIPNEPQLLSILRKTGPLFVTSANKHGISTPETLTDVLSQLHGTPDLVIDGGVLGTVASTLVNCRTSPPKIEREGIVSRVELEQLLGKID